MLHRTYLTLTFGHKILQAEGEALDDEDEDEDDGEFLQREMSNGQAPSRHRRTRLQRRQSRATVSRGVTTSAGAAAAGPSKLLKLLRPPPATRPLFLAAPGVANAQSAYFSFSSFLQWADQPIYVLDKDNDLDIQRYGRLIGVWAMCLKTRC